MDYFYSVGSSFKNVDCSVAFLFFVFCLTIQVERLEKVSVKVEYFLLNHQQNVL